MTEKNTQSHSALKQTAKNNLKVQYWISKWTTHIWIIAIEDKVKRDFLARGLSDIWIWVIVLWTEEDLWISWVSSTVKLNPNSLVWFDFFIYDNEFDWVDVVQYMTVWIVPIMPENNTFTWILKDFNPMKFEWNWFFWKKDSPFCMFEKVISFLENIKFPEDKRVLLKNVMSTF